MSGDIIDIIKSTAAGRARLRELTEQHAASSFAAPAGSATRSTTLSNRRRYDAYLRMREVNQDLTFKEWLTSPLYKERRDSCG